MKLSYRYPLLLVATLTTIAVIGCQSTKTPALVTPVAVTAQISASDLALIQTGATIATGAVLQFVETTPSRRTALANQIYASATALYSLATGTIPSAEEINYTILSFAGANPAENYTQYATALSALYQAYYSKLGGNGENAVSVLKALGLGAQAAAKAYISTPIPQ
jgi:hypothetical protein